MATLFDEYRRLVAADESVEALDDVIDLLIRGISGVNPGRPRRDTTAGRVKVKGPPAARWPGLPSVEQGLATFVDRKSADPTHHGPHAARRAQRLWRVIGLFDHLPPSLGAGQAVPDAQHSLLMDSLLVLFHQAYFALLPTLGGEGRERERSALLAAFRRFADRLPRDADRYHVLGLVFDAHGSSERAAAAFRTAMIATRADEHDFLTRLQVCWSHLCQSGDLSEAGRLLLDVYPRVRRQDLDEVSAMLSDTMSALEKRGTARRAAGA